ncbi:membrane hypothetical protein [Desulfovibrionales bacterium]
MTIPSQAVSIFTPSLDLIPQASIWQPREPLRLLAMTILAVPALVTLQLTDRYLSAMTRNPEAWAMANAANATVRFAGPLLAMAAGAWLLQPAAIAPLNIFYRRWLAGLGLPLLGWSFVYTVYGIKTSSDFTLSPGQLATALLNGRLVEHFVLAYTLLQLLLATPFLQRLALGEPQLLDWFAGLCFLLVSGNALCNDFLGFHFSTPLTMFTTWGGYFTLGRALSRRAFRGRTALTAGLILWTTGWTFTTVANQYLYLQHTPQSAIFVKEETLNILAMTVGIFTVLEALPETCYLHGRTFIILLAPLSLGTALAFDLVRKIMATLGAHVQFFETAVGSRVLGLALTATMVYIISLLLVAGLRRLPGMKWLTGNQLIDGYIKGE